MSEDGGGVIWVKMYTNNFLLTCPHCKSAVEIPKYRCEELSAMFSRDWFSQGLIEFCGECENHFAAEIGLRVNKGSFKIQYDD